MKSVCLVRELLENTLIFALNNKVKIKDIQNIFYEHSKWFASIEKTYLNRNINSNIAVVTFIDVLGWKKMNNRSELLIEYQKILRYCEMNSLMQFFNFYWRKNTFTDVLSLSDTLMIYSICDKNDVNPTLNLHGVVLKNVIREGLIKGFPFRGATATGSIEVLGNVFTGSAIDEAARYYEQSDWIGVHMTPSAMNDYKEGEHRFLSPEWILFKPPLKNEFKKKNNITQEEYYCVNWVKDSQWEVINHFRNGRNDLNNIFVKLIDRSNNKRLIDKYNNTLKFYDKSLGYSFNQTTADLQSTKIREMLVKKGKKLTFKDVFDLINISKYRFYQIKKKIILEIIASRQRK